MELLTPGIGLIFWTTLFFAITWIILGKFAWKPMIGMLNARNKKIEDALDQAVKAREEASRLSQESQKLLRDARQERDSIIEQAKQTHEQIVEKAKTDAQQEVGRMIQNAQKSIEQEKLAAIESLKGEIASLTVDLATKVLGEELTDKAKQEKMLDQAIKDIDL